MKAQRIHQYQSDPGSEYVAEEKLWQTKWHSKVGIDMAWVAGVRETGQSRLEVSLMGGMVYIIHADFASFMLEWIAVRGEPGA